MDAAALYIVTDGITEASVDQDKTEKKGELGFDGLRKIAEGHKTMRGSERVADIMHRFTDQRLVTHDDATLLIVTSVGQS